MPELKEFEDINQDLVPDRASTPRANNMEYKPTALLDDERTKPIDSA